MGFDYGTIKELENVAIKLTFPIDIGGRHYDSGETIMRFDSLELINMNEISKTVTATGGYDNRVQVYWDETKEMKLSFSRGVFNKLQFALMNNAKMISYTENSPILVSAREEVEVDENMQITLSHNFTEPMFIYNTATGNKIGWYATANPKKVDTDASPYTDAIVDYQWEYSGGAQLINIGSKLLNGFLSLEATTNIKDDESGQVVTGLIKIPKIKLISTLSMRLGANASPVSTAFQAVATPVGERHNSYVMEFYFLNNDINSDI